MIMISILSHTILQMSPETYHGGSINKMKPTDDTKNDIGSPLNDAEPSDRTT
jgi:hypothetical protein